VDLASRAAQPAARLALCASLAGVAPSESASGRGTRRRERSEPDPPSARDWARAPLLEARRVAREPELISDGGGLPFPPAALDATPAPLDPEDPAVAALLAHLAARAGGRRGSRAPWRRAQPQPVAVTADGWRQLARTDDEALFGLGTPPSLLTVALRRAGRRRGWEYVGSSAARPLRATRDGIRASSWRLDPTYTPAPEDETVRILLTEQTISGGQRADGRVRPPELYSDGDEIVITLFVTPRPGFQPGAANPETPIRVALGEPVGHRRLIDGALPSPQRLGGAAGWPSTPARPAGEPPPPTPR
jgi:hypothetical protein